MINTGSLNIETVKTLFKKNDTHTINNYRPISLLPSVSKIFEKNHIPPDLLLFSI